MLERINFYYEKDKNQKGTFTPNHTKFLCTIAYNGEEYKFPYQCNLTYFEPNLRDCMECLILDSFSYENAIDILEFANDLGFDAYKDEDKIREAYNNCKDSYEGLNRLFKADELDVIIEEIEGDE